LRILSFAEGASVRKGGVGLVGVPWIAKSLADRGHQIVLNLGGRVSPGGERFVCADLERAIRQPSGAGTFGVVAYPAYGAWAWAPRMNWRLRGHVREADFITLHSLYSFPVLAGYLLARSCGKPYGLWPHGVLAPFQRRIGAAKKGAYGLAVGRRILDHASVLFYSSPTERNEAADLGLRNPSVVLPHGFDFREYSSLRPRGLFRDKYLQGRVGPLIVFLSRLNAKKGLDVLLQAFRMVLKEMPSALLAIVGAGDPPPFEGQVRRWVTEYGVGDRVFMPGLLTGEEKLKVFADADVFALPSQTENFGFAVFEAMASSVAVVVSEGVHYADDIRRYEAGLVVPCGVETFATAILKLVKSPVLRKEMGDNGRRLSQNYSWEKSAEQYEQCICSVLEGDRVSANSSPGRMPRG
jgi:glycosyltransferase involved in cell wall biosynthesis